MCIKVECSEAETKLPELIRGVQAGNRYTITLHGVAGADLVPVQCTKYSDDIRAVDDMLLCMQSRKWMSGINLKALIHKGRA